MTENDESRWIEIEAVGGDLWEPGKAIRESIPYDKLTQRAARDALLHIGHLWPFKTGAVWWPEGGYGYRVYGRKVRKIYKRWRDDGSDRPEKG